MKNIYCYILAPVFSDNPYQCKIEEYKGGKRWDTRDKLLWKSLFDCGVGFIYNGYSHLLIINEQDICRVRCIECNLIQQNEFRKHYKYSTETIDINTQEKLKEMILNFFQYKYATSGITIDNIKLAINPLIGI